jgi:hypothetical protein
MKKALKVGALFLLLYVAAGVLLDQLVFPEPAPDESYFPPVGYVFVSETEGFEPRILKRDGGLFWLETRHSEGRLEGYRDVFLMRKLLACLFRSHKERLHA